MTFENPNWLYLTAILALLLLGLIRYGLRKRDQLLSQFVACRLIASLSHRAQPGRLLFKGFCSVLAITLIGFALAQPQYGTRSVKRSVPGIDIVFAVDCSKSMLVKDLSPDRLQRAKLAVMDLVEHLQGDRVGLVAFAGQAFLQTPLTLDYAAFMESLQSLSPSSITRGGSDIGAALREAAVAFQADDNFKTILLLTDGEDLGGDALTAAQELAEQSIRVYTIGIGTQAGDLLRQQNQLGNTITVRDVQGKPVLSKLDEASLRKISDITQAQYAHINQVRSDALHADIRSVMPSRHRDLEWTEIAIERFQWFLLPAIIILMLEMIIHRRAAKASLLSLFALVGLNSFTPSPAVAQIPGELEPLATATQDAVPISSIPAKFKAAQAAIHTENYDQAALLYMDILTESQDIRQQADACYNQALIANQQSRTRYQSGDLAGALEQMQTAESHAAASLEIFPQDAEYQKALDQITAAKKAIEALIESQEQDSKQDEPSEQDPNASEDPSADGNERGAKDAEATPDPASQERSESEQSANSENPQQQSTSPDHPQHNSAQSEEDSSNNDPSLTESAPNPEEDDAQQSSNDTAKQDAAEATQPNAADMAEASQNSESDPQSAAEESTAAGQAELSAAEPSMGMTEQEAQALLNSIRGQERILPMIPQASQKPQRSTRDW
ncbi:MAG: VWA domain-containing protein [Opitutales bacterium]